MTPVLYALSLHLKGGQTLHWLVSEAELAPFLTPLPTWPKLLYLRLADGGVRQLYRAEVAAVEATRAGAPLPPPSPPTASPADSPPVAGAPPAWLRAPDCPGSATLAAARDPW